MDYDFKEKRIFLDDILERKKLELFLSSEGIKLDKNLEYTVGIYKANELIATGSFFKNTLRCLAVKLEYQCMGVLNTVVSHLENEQYVRGFTHIFLYTKCNYIRFFNNLGFYEVARVDDLLVFMENKLNAVRNYSLELAKKSIKADRVASIVINANPFTLGHQHLIEETSNENDVVHVFVVSEEASVIPFSVRYELVRRGTIHFKNIVLHKTGDYIISNATFPSYFIKDEENVVVVHAKLDLEVYKKYIVPALGINSRYVGEEPYCNVTKKYNEVMKESLENQGIKCKTIPRLNINGIAISASAVRQYIREDRIEEIKGLVPNTTYDYFRSKEAEKIIEIIKNSKSRH
ncbi:MAG TPA: [citrate (pro-3S)-lyase] ligase [Clostridium sp.]|uniref:[citrate (pro-3S)-lyase] ligase n=1 Tax=Clostridium sp. TaxID=1506 RepID=UPI002F92B404